MPTLLASKPGTLVRLAGQRNGPTVVRIQDFPDIFLSAAVLPASVATSMSVGFQVQRTLAVGRLYGYGFGPRVTDIALAGLIPVGTCKTGAAGFGKFVKWYEANNVVARRDPLRILIGGAVFKAYLLNATSELSDPDQLLTRINMAFVAVPATASKRTKGGGVTTTQGSIQTGAEAREAAGI